MKELTVTRNEQRDLIMLRNEVAHHMANTLQPIGGPDGLSFGLPSLPEPINHHSACGNCAYNVICCSLLSSDEVAKLSINHPLRPVLEATVTSRLPSEHLNYFIHWSGLLALEEHQGKNGM